MTTRLKSLGIFTFLTHNGISGHTDGTCAVTPSVLNLIVTSDISGIYEQIELAKVFGSWPSFHTSVSFLPAKQLFILVFLDYFLNCQIFGNNVRRPEGESG